MAYMGYMKPEKGSMVVPLAVASYWPTVRFSVYTEEERSLESTNRPALPAAVSWLSSSARVVSELPNTQLPRNSAIHL